MSECTLSFIGDMTDCAVESEQTGAPELDLVAVAGGEAELPVTTSIAPAEEKPGADDGVEVSAPAPPVVCEGLGRAACVGCPLFQQCLERQRMMEPQEEPKSYLEELLDEDGPEIVVARPAVPETAPSSSAEAIDERLSVTASVRPSLSIAHAEAELRQVSDEVVDGRVAAVESDMPRREQNDLLLTTDSVLTVGEAAPSSPSLQLMPDTNDTPVLPMMTEEVGVVGQQLAVVARGALSNRPDSSFMANAEPCDDTGDVMSRDAVWAGGDDAGLSSAPTKDCPSPTEQSWQATGSQKAPMQENSPPDDVKITTKLIVMSGDDQRAAIVSAVMEPSRSAADVRQIREVPSWQECVADSEAEVEDREVVSESDKVVGDVAAHFIDYAGGGEVTAPVDVGMLEVYATPEMQSSPQMPPCVAENQSQPTATHHPAADPHPPPQPMTPAVALLQDWYIAAQQMTGVDETDDGALPGVIPGAAGGGPAEVQYDEPAELIVQPYDVNNTTLSLYYDNDVPLEDNPEYKVGGAYGITASSVVDSIVLGVVAVWATVRGLARQPATA
ncbi:MAG: hypothetical protein Q4A34_01000 [Candidatus Saccharibacteria bacterium]|nr:hypothetical protein [Candidatus Saccharibacteria bacterium]